MIMKKMPHSRFDSNELFTLSREAMERSDWKKAIDFALETESYESAVESICRQLYVSTRDSASREGRIDRLHETFSYFAYGLCKVYDKKGNGEFLPYEKLPRGICDYLFSMLQDFGILNFNDEFSLILEDEEPVRARSNVKLREQ